MTEIIALFLRWLQDPAFDLALITFCMVVLKDCFEDPPQPPNLKEEQPKLIQEACFQTFKSEDCE